MELELVDGKENKKKNGRMGRREEISDF